MSAGELSSDGTATSGRHSRGSGTHSPATASRIPYAATVPRSQRFNPISVPSPRTRSTAKVAAARRRRSRNEESDEEDDDFEPTPTNATAGGSSDSRREFIRRQRIESEQRRRDDLRDGYARLKDILPPSNQKASKASLLKRGMSITSTVISLCVMVSFTATCHLRHLESCKATLENNLANTEAEVRRLRDVNERLMLGTAEHRRATAAASSSTLVPALSF